MLFGFYQLFFRPFLVAISGSNHHVCRFDPSCSVYAKQCLENCNIFKATAYILWRVLRCNPWVASKVYFDAAPSPKGIRS